MAHRDEEGAERGVGSKPGEPDDPGKLREAEEELGDEAVEPDQPTYPPPPPEGTETTEPVREG